MAWDIMYTITRHHFCIILHHEHIFRHQAGTQITHRQMVYCLYIVQASSDGHEKLERSTDSRAKLVKEDRPEPDTDSKSLQSYAEHWHHDWSRVQTCGHDNEMQCGHKVYPRDSMEGAKVSWHYIMIQMYLLHYDPSERHSCHSQCQT